jgi:hypothetical protein
MLNEKIISIDYAKLTLTDTGKDMLGVLSMHVSPNNVD